MYMSDISIRVDTFRHVPSQILVLSAFYIPKVLAEIDGRPAGSQDGTDCCSGMLLPPPVLGPLLGVLLGTGVPCRIGTLRSARPTCCALDAPEAPPDPPEAPPDDMTIGEMAQQLAQVRAYYRELGELEQQDVCRHMLASRIDALRLNRCRVASSDLHGNGLFATRAIEEGELITFYPGDAVILWLGGHRTEAGVPDETGVIFGAHVPDEQRDVIAALEYATHGLAAYAIGRLSGVALCKGLATAPQVVKKDRANGETAGG